MDLFRCRAERVGKGELCAVDSTSMSTYGFNLVGIRWGKNKECLPLRQTLEVVVYSLTSHMPIYYIADYIHSYNLDFYWVPWYEAYNNTKWKDYGFDKAWLQPNYHFDANATRQRLYDAYDKATANGMLLEMEWDNLKPLQKHIDYWDVYEEKGVLADWPLTYYESGSMFPSRDNIIDPDWKAFYERVAKDIADRQKKFYNY